MTRATTLTRLEEAMGRLLAGQPTQTDGELTVSNLCAEAGVGRDSYYRSPQIIEKFTAAKANADARKPEFVALREELAEVKRQLKAQTREAAAERRALEETITSYANQIQALALRNAELETQNGRLRERLEATNNVSRLDAAKP
jgi:predicted nuclease with TOPRIM domain